MTTLLAAPCHTCGEPVTVVRRPVLIVGHQGCNGRGHPPCRSAESAELSEVVTLRADGERHECRKVRVL